MKVLTFKQPDRSLGKPPDYKGLCSHCRHRQTGISTDRTIEFEVCTLFIIQGKYFPCDSTNPNSDCNKWQAKPWAVFLSWLRSKFSSSTKND